MKWLVSLQMNSDEPLFETALSCHRQRPHFSLKAFRKVSVADAMRLHMARSDSKEKRTDSKENEMNSYRPLTSEAGDDNGNESGGHETDYNSDPPDRVGRDSPLSFVPLDRTPSTRGKRGADYYHETSAYGAIGIRATSRIAAAPRKTAAVESEWHPPILPPIPSSPPLGAISATSHGLVAPPNSPTPWALGGETDILLKPLTGLDSNPATTSNVVACLETEQSSDFFNMGIEHVYIGGTRLKTKRRLSIDPLPEEEKQNKDTVMAPSFPMNDGRKRKRKGSGGWAPYVVCPEVGCSFLAQNQTALAAHRASTHKITKSDSEAIPSKANVSRSVHDPPPRANKTRTNRLPSPPVHSAAAPSAAPPPISAVPPSAPDFAPATSLAAPSAPPDSAPEPVVVKTCSVANLSLDVGLEVSPTSLPVEVCEIETPAKPPRKQLKKIRPTFEFIPKTETLPPRALFPPPDFAPRTNAQRKRLLARSAAAS